jgi:hypothetical protein
MNKLPVTLFLLLLLTSGGVFAQSSVSEQFSIVLNDKCLLSTNTTPSPVSMTLSTSVAGSAVSPVTNSNMYMKVTSIAPVGSTRKISAIITNGNVPPGTILKLVSAPCTNLYSQGSLGTVVPTPVTLNKTSNQTIVDGIGSCYTGTSPTDGYQLTFTWQPDNTNYYLINATPQATAVTITFTIAANN